MKTRHEDIVQDLYDNISQDIVDIIADPDISDFITILEVLSHIASMVELIKIGDKPVKGKEKKHVVKTLGRMLLEQHCPEQLKESVLEVYESNIDSALEILVNFAKNNKVIRKTRNACC
tara:strand:- start:535 stop:891 length:357 start_codon:yes stop_codon:yes gene_type:complete